MARTVGIWSVRLGLGAVIYIIVTYAMVQQATGWDRLGIFVAGFAFGLIAILSWCIAIAVGRFVTSAGVRMLIHPVLTVLLFVVLSVAIVGWLQDTAWESLWRDLRPFVFLVGGISLIEAVIGFLFERRDAASPVG